MKNLMLKVSNVTDLGQPLYDFDVLSVQWQTLQTATRDNYWLSEIIIKNIKEQAQATYT